MKWFEYQRLDIDNTCAIQAPSCETVLQICGTDNIVAGTINEITEQEALFIFEHNKTHGIKKSIIAPLL